MRPDLQGQSILALMTEGSQRNLLRAQAFIDYVNGRWNCWNRWRKRRFPLGFADWRTCVAGWRHSRPWGSHLTTSKLCWNFWAEMAIRMSCWMARYASTRLFGRHRPAFRMVHGRYSMVRSIWPGAEAEVGYHVAKAAAGTTATLYYQRLECDLDGVGYNLCVHTHTWPFLTDPNEQSAYPRCQSIALEARSRGAYTLLTRSARLSSGINAPVFIRTALANPEIVGGAALVAEPGGVRVVIGTR